MEPVEKEMIASILEKAEDFARIGGDIGRYYFGRNIAIETKADETPVTRADKEAETAMRQHIEREYSSHQILGEEFGLSGSPHSPWKWIIDPIDGTISFIHGVPLYTVLVGLLYRGEPVLGVIYNPQTEELISAGNGLGCFYNGQPSTVSSIANLAESRFLLGEPAEFLNMSPRAAELIGSVKWSMGWGDGHAYLMLASGRAELVIDPIVSIWDIACIMPIVQEAGGTFTDFQGRARLGTQVVASNGIIHDAVLTMVDPHHDDHSSHEKTY